MTEETQDWRDLLVRYMVLIFDEEGIDYLDHALGGIRPDKLFTKDEMTLLRAVSDEAHVRFNEWPNQ